MITLLINGFGDSSSGLGALGFSGSAFLIQLITFVLAFLILKKYAFKPILKIMKERQETIESGVELGERMKKEQVEMDEKVKKELYEARTKADAIIADAQDTAKETVRGAETKALEKADVILADAKEKAEQQARQTKQKLEGEIIELVAEATEVLTEEKVDAKKDSSLIAKALGKAA